MIWENGRCSIKELEYILNYSRVVFTHYVKRTTPKTAHFLVQQEMRCEFLYLIALSYDKYFNSLLHSRYSEFKISLELILSSSYMTIKKNWSSLLCWLQIYSKRNATQSKPQQDRSPAIRSTYHVWQFYSSSIFMNLFLSFHKFNSHILIFLIRFIQTFACNKPRYIVGLHTYLKTQKFQQAKNIATLSSFCLFLLKT